MCNNNLIITHNLIDAMKESSPDTYTLVNQFDVYGNAKDGYDVNNQCIEKSDIKLDDTSDMGIIKKLKELDMLKKHVRRNMLNIMNDGEMIIVEARDGRPLFYFQLNYFK